MLRKLILKEKAKINQNKISFLAPEGPHLNISPIRDKIQLIKQVIFKHNTAIIHIY